MRMLGIRDLKILPALGEEAAPGETEPERIVTALAAHKGREVAAKCAPEDVIVAADTMVWHRGRVFGKPRSEAEAADMLRELSGDVNEVYTGLYVRRGEQELSRAVKSRVRFKRLSEEEIAAYIATGEPMDKAGAYGAQGRAALFIEGIEGDFFNVVGLPVYTLGVLLRELGVRLL